MDETLLWSIDGIIMMATEVLGEKPVLVPLYPSRPP
jgi:hypothetical protein